MKHMTVVFVLCAAVLAAGVVPAGDGDFLPPPPFKTAMWPGWRAEHVAFTLGSSGRPIGGPARWAVGGVLPKGAKPVEQEKELYNGKADSDVRIFFSDQRRRFWILEKGNIWPINCADDIGELDGPAPVARFIFTGVYGGRHSGMVATGCTLFVMDNGWLRRIQKADDGTWHVKTVAGQGKTRKLEAGQTANLADLGALGKGLTVDPEGNLYFTMGGGLLKADKEGKVSWVVTRDKVSKDVAAIYAKKWPDAKVPRVSIGSGEGVNLVRHSNGCIYGGGRCYPQSWKVTPEGAYVPLNGYAPKGQWKKVRWGEGDPAYYAAHCPMGFGVTSDGYTWLENENPSARSRYEDGKVTVLATDFAWKLLGPKSKEVLNYLNMNGMSLNSDGTVVRGNAPGRAFHGRSVYLRGRREGK